MGATGTEDVTLYNELGDAVAVVKRDTTSANLPEGAPNLGIVIVGGVQSGSPDTYRALKTDATGQIYVANSGVAALAALTATTSAACSPQASVDLTVPAGYPHVILRLLEVRPSVADNTFSIDIYRDSGRTKRVFSLNNIASNEFVTDEEIALVLDGNLYVTITNNNVSGSRTYTVEGVVEVRG
jgi:hypothetical protein